MRADVVDDEDVGVVELGGGAGFLLEAREAFGIGGEARVDDLDRDFAPEPRVARPVDLAHAARAERREDLVGAELRSRGEAHAVCLPGSEEGARSCPPGAAALVPTARVGRITGESLVRMRTAGVGGPIG